jgi:predicted HTH transcriptional regulator
MEYDALKKFILNGNTEVNHFGVEFKRNWSQGHGEDISAVANVDQLSSGWLVIGLNDDGTPHGHDENWLKRTELDVSNHIRQYLEPSWAVSRIFGEKINGACCLFIEIKNPQDVVKWNGNAYKLIGTTSSKMREDEVLALSLKLPGMDFSKNKYEGIYNASLVTAFAQKISKETNDFDIDVNKVAAEEILRKLNIFQTITAGILFGDYTFRIVNFDEDGDIIDQKSNQGLYQILSEPFIEQIQSRSRKKGTQVEGVSISAQEETPYPIKALREVLANAVAHSLYQKNGGDIVVEIHPNRITVRNNCSKEAKIFIDKWLSRINKPVNKHLMNTLRAAKITDEQGTGKIRIFRLMLESGRREPIIDFQELGDYCRWSITLFNEEANKELKQISDEIKPQFENQDQWRLATALLLWRNRDWSEIEKYFDEHYKYVAEQVLINQHSPVLKFENRLYTKRWASVRLTGQVTKQFSEAEKSMFLMILSRYSFDSGRNGHIESEQARRIIGLSDHQSEKTQLARLFSEWRDKGLMEQIKKGHWRFNDFPQIDTK